MSNSTLDTKSPLTIGIVAGEISGDALGADFMQKMNAIHPNIRWVGVGGDGMKKMGLDSIIDMKRLSVMGLIEVVKHLPDLLSAKKEIVQAFFDHKIDIFVGIDAPDFNLRVAKTLKKQAAKYQTANKSIFCVQYVSPSVWAWREGRIDGIKAATDLVLCLFPFETPVYDRHNHPAVCVGHPLLQKITQADDGESCAMLEKLVTRLSPNFATLSQATRAYPVCVMAGSRNGEINAILPTLTQAMRLIKQTGDFCFLLPVVSREHAELVTSIIKDHADELLPFCHVIFEDSTNQRQDNNTLSLSQHTMSASKLVLLASGTATLECLLLHRPMVVVYKVNKLTYTIAKNLVKIPYFSLPNILSYNRTGSPIVPELIQDMATAENIANEALSIIQNPAIQTASLITTTQTLRQDSHHDAALSVLQHYAQKTCNTQR